MSLRDANMFLSTFKWGFNLTTDPISQASVSQESPTVLP